MKMDLIFNNLHKTKPNQTKNHNTDFFDIVAGVLRRDTFVLCLLIICLNYVLLT